MQPPKTINVLVERDGDWWVAQCLQINLATQARTLPELRAEVVRIVNAHFDTCKELGADPFRMPAPKQFWDKYFNTTEALNYVDPERPNANAMPQLEARIAA